MIFRQELSLCDLQEYEDKTYSKISEAYFHLFIMNFHSSTVYHELLHICTYMNCNFKHYIIYKMCEKILIHQVKHFFGRSKESHIETVPLNTHICFGWEIIKTFFFLHILKLVV